MVVELAIDWTTSINISALTLYFTCVINRAYKLGGGKRMEYNKQHSYKS